MSETQTYNAMTAAMRKAWAADGKPMVAHLDVTYRCDLDCKHCYLDQKEGPEMTTAEWRSAILQLAEAGVLTLIWSGGEVLLRPDFGDLLNYAASLNLFARVKTHAGNITPEWAARLRAAHTSQLDVSVYSLRPDVHDAFTKRPGSLAATVTGIQNALAAGVPVRVSTYVLREAIDEIPGIFRYFSDLGCEVVFATTTQRDLSATTTLDHLELPWADLVRARKLIAATLQRSRGLSLAQHGEADPCQAARTLVYVGPDGGVWPCINFPMTLGSLRDQPFATIWRESPERKAVTDWTNADRTTCQSCAGSGFCTYCPGDAYKTTGDFRKAPGHFHAEARARMIAWEALRGPTFSAEEWQTVPGDEGRPEAADTFVFPIHKRQRGAGARVKSTAK